MLPYYVGYADRTLGIRGRSGLNREDQGGRTDLVQRGRVAGGEAHCAPDARGFAPPAVL